MNTPASPAIPTEADPPLFPRGFLWGAATSSYQIEGAAAEDGRGPSIWDTFSRVPGKIFQGHNGDVACDHYHRYKEDVRLMADIGLNAYRFSIAWPRVIPQGTGAVNKRGLDFYDRLVDELLKNGIAPFVTLYHWDLPQALEDKGGWRVRDTAQAFADYAAVVVDRLSDRVTRWMTLNEPYYATQLGYREGNNAPGAQEPVKVVNQVIHHFLLAHGLAVRAIRQRTRKPCEIGLAHTCPVKFPATDSPGDLAAAHKAWKDVNGWWLEPLRHGRYPEDLWRRQGEDVPRVTPGDMEIISTPVDFIGLNIYSGDKVAADLSAPHGYREVPCPADFPKTDIGWCVHPESMYHALKFLSGTYAFPKHYITENGCAFNDVPGPDGKVHDARRIDYLRRYLSAAHRALKEGVKLDGYFLWSFMDNYEWGMGYSQRFGVVHVDYPTQKRTMKDSALWYKEFIGRHAPASRT